MRDRSESDAQSAGDPPPATPSFTVPEQVLTGGHLAHSKSGLPLAQVRVEAVDRDRNVVASAVTDASGWFELRLDERPAMRQIVCRFSYDADERLLIRAVEHADGAVVASTSIDHSSARRGVALTVGRGKAPDAARLEMLSEFLRSSRRVRVADVASDLTNPSADSPLTVFSVVERVYLLERLAEAAGRESRDGELDLLSDERFLDPRSVRRRRFVVDPHTLKPIFTDLPIEGKAKDFDLPIFEKAPWAKPDDQSYRDYLRGVFVLYAHQQALQFSGNMGQWVDVVHRQLWNRFFQDFHTTDRTSQPLNELLIPIVTRLLSAAAGLGLGVAPGSIPPRGTLSARAYLDALLALSPVAAAEVANRYRIPLFESDAVLSTPVLLNIYTLKRILSDTAQGPLEPEDNAIVPQLPGHEGKPILWDTVVGVAPFFLRYEEWLARQRPFHGENLFSLRMQVQALRYGEPWLTGISEGFVKKIASTGVPMNSADAAFFANSSEARRSAQFLVDFAAADAKLAEVFGALDAGDFLRALRLAGEARGLLHLAKPDTNPGENWTPAQTPEASNARSLSFARRRKLPVTNIRQLVGDSNNPEKSLEGFFHLPRPGIHDSSYYLNIRSLYVARALAVSLVSYHQSFLLPIVRSHCHLQLGAYADAVRELAAVTAFYVGIAEASSEPGAAQLPNQINSLRNLYAQGNLPYTVRLAYDAERFLSSPQPFSPLHSTQAPSLGPGDLHRVEETYVRLLQGEAMLRWAEVLYRTDEPSNRERARELYKGVMFLHGEEPGTSAYARALPLQLIWLFKHANPRLAGQIERARLALFQLEAGLNFYGYSEEAVPTLRYRTLIDAAGRWSSGAKAAQNDFLAYLTRLEQLDLDILAARAQQQKANAFVLITAQQTDIAKAGVVGAQRLVKEVEKLIEAKAKEIEEHDSFFGQWSDYLSGMKDSVTSLVDAGRATADTTNFLSIASHEQIKGGVKSLGSSGLQGGWAGGLAVVGAMAAFATMSYITLQGMAEAYAGRDAELAALRNDALPAAHAAVRVQERQVAIAQLQQVIAATDLAYATDLVAYHSERFLNRDFWAALSTLAHRVMRRQLDLAAQAAWFAERALAYETGRAIRIVRLDYFNQRFRDIGGVDRLMLDVAELEGVRLSSLRLTVPIRQTYSLARDFPLAFGALKQRGRCVFGVADQDLADGHPGTFAHRLRAVSVHVEAPGATVLPRGMLSNRGLSFLRRSPAGARLPLVRFEDGLPVSEFRMRDDMGVHQMPGEQLMPFEGSGFATVWELEFPPAANSSGLGPLSDVLITFDVRAEYAPPSAVFVPTDRVSRSLFVSALAVDTEGLTSLTAAGGASGTVRFPLDQMSLAGGAAAAAPKITNFAVLVPGVNTGTLDARARLVRTATTVAFPIERGLASSNNAHLSDAVPPNPQPLNALAGHTPSQTIEITIHKAGVAQLLAQVRDVVLWVEYDHAL